MARFKKGTLEWYWLVLKSFRYPIIIVSIVVLALILGGCKDTKKVVKTDIHTEVDSVKTDKFVFSDTTFVVDSTNVSTNIDENTTTIKVEFADGQTIDLKDITSLSNSLQNFQNWKDFNLCDMKGFNAKSIEITKNEKKTSQNKQNAVKIGNKNDIELKDSVNIDKKTNEQTKTKDESKESNKKFGVGFVVCFLVFLILFWMTKK